MTHVVMANIPFILAISSSPPSPGAGSLLPPARCSAAQLNAAAARAFLAAASLVEGRPRFLGGEVDAWVACEFSLVLVLAIDTEIFYVAMLGTESGSGRWGFGLRGSGAVLCNLSSTSIIPTWSITLALPFTHDSTRQATSMTWTMLFLHIGKHSVCNLLLILIIQIHSTTLLLCSLHVSTGHPTSQTSMKQFPCIEMLSSFNLLPILTIPGH